MSNAICIALMSSFRPGAIPGVWLASVLCTGAHLSSAPLDQQPQPTSQGQSQLYAHGTHERPWHTGQMYRPPAETQYLQGGVAQLDENLFERRCCYQADTALLDHINKAGKERMWRRRSVCKETAHNFMRCAGGVGNTAIRTHSFEAPLNTHEAGKERMRKTSVQVAPAILDQTVAFSLSRYITVID